MLFRKIACVAALAAVWIAAAAVPAAFAQKYTVDSPEVRRMVARGVEFLKTKQGKSSAGYDILAGYAVYHATEDPDHPLVKYGVEKALDALNRIDEVEVKSLHEFNYYVSISAQLLASVDPITYAPQLQTVLQRFQDRQKASGAFGYAQSPYEQLGDVSQTQYVILGLWAMEHANVDIPHEMAESTLIWLGQAQGQGGGWPYQFPGGNEYPPTHVMTAVGMSAVMIGADLLGILRGGGSALAETTEVDEGIPAAFRRVIEEDPSNKTQVSRQAVAEVVRRGKSWIDSHPYRRKPGETWHYYWLYSIERYQAFWDAMNGQTQASPAWYNEGVTELAKLQSPEGGWGVLDSDFGSPSSCTSFAILFLLRTTQKSIGDLNEAILLGGQGGLKADMSQVDLVGGKVEDKKQITDIDEALANLSDSTDNQTAAKLASRIRLDSDPAARNRQLQAFARLLRSSDAASRIIAAKLLCRGDNLDMVPHLIYALSDVEPAVARHAENSLRVLSRQLDTYKIPPTGEVTEDDRRAAQEYWMAWFKTIRPDYVFLQKNQ